MTDQMAPLPDLVLEPGMTLVFRAVDLATGGNVAGVPVSEISIYVDSGDAADTTGTSAYVEPVFPYGENL